MRRKILTCITIFVIAIAVIFCIQNIPFQTTKTTELLEAENSIYILAQEIVKENINNKNALFEILVLQMMKGDFSDIKETEKINAENLEKVYGNISEDTEWIFADINKDSKKDLIWQRNSEDKIKPIIGIFDIQNQGECVFFDNVDMTEYFFVTENENLIYYSDYFGIYDCVSFTEYHYDKDWKRSKGKTINSYYVYDEKEAFFWFEEHPYIKVNESGVYFMKSFGEDEWELTEEEYKEEFEQLTQVKYDDLKKMADVFWLD